MFQKSAQAFPAGDPHNLCHLTNSSQRTSRLSA
jgi:hypothetical protein